MVSYREVKWSVDKGIGIQVLDRRLMAEVVHNQPYRVLSITDPNQNLNPEWAAIIAPSPYLQDVHRTEFFDVEEECEGKFKTYGPINQEQAANIARWMVEGLNLGIKLFVIHCEMGCSRSSGAAAALWAKLTDDERPMCYFRHHFFHPNRTVYRLLKQELDAIM